MVDLSMLQDFIAETGEHLEEMETKLLELEENPGEREILDDIFRSAHTIKGSAEYLGMERIGELSHKLENLLEMLRKGERSPDKEIIDTLIAARDRIVLLISDLERSEAEETEIKDLIERIDELSSKQDEPEVDLSPDEKAEYTDDEDQARLDKEVEDIIDDMEQSSGSQDEYEERTSRATSGDSSDQNPDHNELGNDLRHEASSETENEEFYEEEHDEELFSIFLQKLKESLSTLKDHLEDLHELDNTSETLEKCLDCVNELKASANYMDYQKLTQLYAAWCDEITSAQERLFQGDDVSFEFMEDYVNKIMRLFPRLKEMDEQQDKQSSVDILQENEGNEMSGAMSVDDKGQDVMVEAEDEEIYDEEYDEELFGIFIRQLEDNLSFLRAQTGEMRESENSAEILGKCLECINSLRSSANYMDYKKLTRLHDNWCAEITSVQEKLSSGEKVSFEFMDKYADRIVNLFPRLKEHDVSLPAEESKAEEEIEDFLQAERVLVADTEGQDDIAPSIEDQMSGAAQSTPRTNDMALYDALDTTFDSFMSQPQASEAEPGKGEQEVEILSEGEPANKGALFDEAIAGESAKSVDIADQIVSAQLGEKESVKEVRVERRKAERRMSGRSKGDRRQFARRESDRLAEKVVRQSVRVDAKKIDSLMNQAGELVISRAWFSQLATEMREYQQDLLESAGLDQRDMKRIRDLTFRLVEATTSLGRVANDLQEGVMKMRMLPIARLFNRYPRLVHDLVRDTGKQVHLEIRGEETELDKVIIEEISDPLVHLIRNAVDHGIEGVEERRKLGKPAVGKIVLEAYHESNHVVIEITDDGKGIDTDRIRAVAFEKDLLPRDELDRMGPKELMGLTMMPGFSTASEITKTSGRGVGMDVVKKNIEKLNGSIEIESKPGKETRIRTKIPLTLAIIRALLVRVGPEIFTIPLAAVEKTLRIFDGDTSIMEEVEVIHLGEETLPLVRLSEVFNITSSSQGSGKSFVVIVSAGMKRVGLVVDVLIGQEEVVIKPLEDYLQEDSGFSGATILGDGRISLILDVYELITLCVDRQTRMRNQLPSLGRPARDNRPEITGGHIEETIH